jgi:hypothetical protein
MAVAIARARGSSKAFGDARRQFGKRPLDDEFEAILGGEVDDVGRRGVGHRKRSSAPRCEGLASASDKVRARLSPENGQRRKNCRGDREPMEIGFIARALLTPC